jgi:serine/threonine protein kinase
MCDAVAHAHERGILHRDLKPGNVIVRETGEGVIVDWGLAGWVQPNRPFLGPHPSPLPEGERVIVGTPQYMAPEQVDREESNASDIFSLGATLYEVLTGRPPYHWKADFLPPDWQDIVRQARIAPPRRLVSNTPRALETICLKALAKAAEGRYATAADLATDLRQFLSEQQSTGWLNRIRMFFR